MTLAELTRHAAARLPADRVGRTRRRRPGAVVRTLAVSGGAGDAFLADAAAAGVDAYLTADLRHHPASEHLAGGGPALLDAAHWATERPWLDDARRRAARPTLRRRDARVRPRHRPVDACTRVRTRCRDDEGAPTVKADPEAQRRLLDLQAIDTALAQLAHRRQTLPEHAELDALARELSALEDERVRAQVAVDDLDRDIARLEKDVEQVRARERPGPGPARRRHRPGRASWRRCSTSWPRSPAGSASWRTPSWS